MSSSQNERGRLHALFSSLADSIDELSDADWRQEIATISDIDTKGEAASIRAVLLGAVQESKRFD